MRSVVCCDVINLLAFVIHNRRPQSEAILTRLEILAWSFAIYLHLHLFLRGLPLFSFQISIQFAHQRNLTNRLHESIDMNLCQESTLLSSSLCLPSSHYFTVSSPYSCLLPSGHILFGWPVKVAKQSVHLLTVWNYTPQHLH